MFEEDSVPTLRGLLHAYAVWFAAAAAIVLVWIAEDESRLPAAIYGVGLTALFAVSGLYHRWRWDMRWRPLLRRMDHSTIFLFIAASSTPVTWLVLDGPLRTVSLVAVWAGAIGGIALSIAWITAPRILVAMSYLVVGWAGAIGIPQIADRLPATPLVLLAVGGVLYTVGAVVYALKRPNPWPRTFGFHEVFHALVVAAAIVHFVAMAGWVVPFASG